MFNYELWYDKNYVAEDDGFEDEYEAMEDAYETVKSKMQEWEYDCEQAVFLIKLKYNGSLLDEIDGVELEASL